MAEPYLCAAESLIAFAHGVFRHMGADDEIAAEVARHLVRANLSGHDSHGVIRVPQYVAQAESGELDATARPTLLRETAVTALIDARRGFGHYSTAWALDWAMEHARSMASPLPQSAIPAISAVSASIPSEQASEG